MIGTGPATPASHSSGCAAKELDTRAGVGRMMEALDHVKRTQRESP